MAYSINEDYETQLNEAEERIIELEKQLAEAKRPNENGKLNMQIAIARYSLDEDLEERIARNIELAYKMKNGGIPSDDYDEYEELSEDIKWNYL